MEEERLNRCEESKKIEQGTNLLIQFILDTKTSHIPVVQLTNQLEANEKVPIVFVLPGVEGNLKPFEVLTSSMKTHVVDVQYNYQHPENNIQEIAQNTISVCFSSTCVSVALKTYQFLAH